MSTEGRTSPRRAVFARGAVEMDLVGDDRLVALTPTALASSIAVGVEPCVLDDIVDRRGLVVDRRHDYMTWQLDWFDRLAAAGSAPSDAVVAGLVHLKAPVDSVVVSARLLRAAVEAIAPAEVVYVGDAGPEEADPWHAGHLEFAPQLGDVPLAARLLPLVAADLGVAFRHVSVPAAAEPAPDPRPAGWLRRAKDLVATYRNLWAPSKQNGARSSASLLLWTTGYGARVVVRDEQAAGQRVLALKRGGATTSVLQPTWSGFRRLAPRVPVRLPVAAKELTPMLHELLEEVDEPAGTPGAWTALASRMSSYMNRLCPTVDRVAKQLAPVLARNGVTRVLATNPFTVEEFGALVAAARLGSPECTLFQHGDHVFPYDFWLASETNFFDTWACSDPTVPADIESAARALGRRTPRCRLSSPRLRDFTERATRLPPWSKRRQPKLVCYVPTHLLGDLYVVSGAGFDDAWYIRWQLSLLDLMVRRSDFEFIWKAPPSATMRSPDLVRDVISERRPSNVRYDTRPFRAVAGEVDRVLLDFASTPLYESVHLGKSVLAISFEAFEEVRPSAVSMLGKVLRRCKDESEALVTIDRFLLDPPEQWIARPPELLSLSDPRCTAVATRLIQ